MVATVHVVFIGGCVLAVYLINKQKEKGEWDKESYLAGWVTPGPLTIAAAGGALIYFSR